MKKLLMIGAMVLLVWFNMHSLFGNDRVSSVMAIDCVNDFGLQAEFSVYDTTVGIKNKLYSLIPSWAKNTTSMEPKVSEQIVKNTISIEPKVGEQRAKINTQVAKTSKEAVNKLKSILEAANEETMQSFLNLVAKEIVITQQLINYQTGDLLRMTVSDRNVSLRCSSPTARELYENTMDLATSDDRLRTVTRVGRSGCMYTKNVLLNAKNKRTYLKSVKKTLENTYALVQKMQYQIASSSNKQMRDALAQGVDTLKAPCYKIACNMYRPVACVATAIDTQGKVGGLDKISDCNKRGRNHCKKVTCVTAAADTQGTVKSELVPCQKMVCMTRRQRIAARKTVKSPSLVSACKLFYKALDSHVNKLNTTTTKQS